MMQENRIFCVCCRDIELIEAASTVFRTGFYKNSIHLGICSLCAEQEKTNAIVHMAAPHDDYSADAEEL